MPTYQYACTACGHELEKVQSFTDDPLTQCPECQGRLRKLFGSVGVVFKGPGFYRTDSRNANSNGAGTRGDKSDKSDMGAEGAGKGADKGGKGSGDGGKDAGSASSGDSAGTDSSASTSQKAPAAAGSASS